MKHIYCSICFRRALAPIIHGRVIPHRKISSHRVTCSEKRSEQIAIKYECHAMHFLLLPVVVGAVWVGEVELDAFPSSFL
jgi:hypothetical protein